MRVGVPEIGAQGEVRTGFHWFFLLLILIWSVEELGGGRVGWEVGGASLFPHLLFLNSLGMMNEGRNWQDIGNSSILVSFFFFPFFDLDVVISMHYNWRRGNDETRCKRWERESTSHAQPSTKSGSKESCLSESNYLSCGNLSSTSPSAATMKTILVGNPKNPSLSHPSFEV